MLTTLVAWSLLVSFLVLQRVLRRGEEARSLQASAADRGSTKLLGAAFLLGALALVAAPVLNAQGIAEAPGGPPLGLKRTGGRRVRVGAGRGLVRSCVWLLGVYANCRRTRRCIGPGPPSLASPGIRLVQAAPAGELCVRRRRVSGPAESGNGGCDLGMM